MSFEAPAGPWLGVALLTASLAVSSLTTVAACSGTGCDPNSCKAGNECLSDGQATECRLVCEGSDQCPTNYACTKVESAPKAFCAPVKAPVTEGPGIWGATCRPSLGVSPNADCDDAQAFSCQATSPTDGSAFCTQFFCKDDTDCAGGYFCARENQAPNANNAKRSFGQTWEVCLPRTYCSPCSADNDCPKSASGDRMRCVTSELGDKFCAPPCNDDANCALDATCKGSTDLQGAAVCQPRAGTCKGDGSYCSPCLSDADCSDGLCITAQFSTEHFCSVKSTTTCTTGGALTGCPVPPASDARAACTTQDNETATANQCVAVVKVGANPVLGCWTRPRQ